MVSLTAATESPSGAVVSSWGTWIATLNPVGVLPCSPSGRTLIDGLNGSASHPSTAGIGASASSNWLSVGSRCAQESPVTVLSKGSGCPVAGLRGHEVGSEMNAGGCSIPAGGHDPPVRAARRHSVPRNASWLGSPGTPHTVTSAERNPAFSLMFSVLTVIP